MADATCPVTPSGRTVGGKAGGGIGGVRNITNLNNTSSSSAGIGAGAGSSRKNPHSASATPLVPVPTAVSEFITEVCVKLRLPQAPISTAIAYMHRFASIRSLNDFDPYVLATTCIFLACKAEEKVKRVRDVLNVSYGVQHPDKPALRVSKLYWDLKNEMLVIEQVVLRTLSFDTTVEHPYRYMLNYVRALQASPTLAQTAWSVLNDSASLGFCMHHPPHLLAVASMHVAALLTAEALPMEPTPWYEYLDVNLADIQGVCEGIVTMYEDASTRHEGSAAAAAARAMGGTQS